MASTPQPDWLRDTFRTVFLRAQPDGSGQGVAAALTPDGVARLAELLATSHVQAICFVAKDERGHALYRTRVPGARMDAHIQRDYVRAMVEAAQAAGLRTVAYYSAGWDAHQAAVHPRWRMRRSDGTPLRLSPSAAFPAGPPPCLLSPYAERIVLPQLLELVQRYQPDAIWLGGLAWQFQEACYCPSCRRAFSRWSEGAAIPTDVACIDALRFRRWRLGQQRALLSHIAARLRAVRPSIALVASGAYSAALPEAPLEQLDYLSAQYMAGVADPLTLSFEGRYLATTGARFELLSLRTQNWSDWTLRPLPALEVECATILANGGRCVIGDRPYPDGSLEPAVYGTIGGTYEFVQAREAYCRDAEPVPYVAILHSATTYWGKAPLDHDAAALLPIRGAHKMLLESGVHVQILNEETLLRDGGRYAAMILPDQAYLSRHTLAALVRYVEEGGGLIASYQTAFWDEERQRYQDPPLAHVFGVTYAGAWPHASPHATGYLQPGAGFLVGTAIHEMPLQVPAPFALVQAPAESTLCRLRHPLAPPLPAAGGQPDIATDQSPPPGAETMHPAVTLNRFGQGRAVLIAGEIFGAYARSNAPDLKYVVARCLELVVPRERRLITLEAPPSVEVSLWRQPADEGGAGLPYRYVVHLVNYHAEKTTTGAPMIESVPVLRGVQVLLRVEREPRRVTQQPEGEPLEWTSEADRIVVVVPRLHVHSCLVVEF